MDSGNGKVPRFIQTEEALRTYVHLLTVETRYLLGQVSLVEDSVAHVLMERVNENYAQLERMKPLARRYAEMVAKWLN
jgi:BioD-like phosphotransacetylase family protein